MNSINVSFRFLFLLICLFVLAAGSGYMNTRAKTSRQPLSETSSASLAETPTPTPTATPTPTPIPIPTLKANPPSFSLKINDATKKSQDIVFKLVTKNADNENVETDATGVTCKFVDSGNIQQLNKLVTIINPPNSTDVSKVTLKTTDTASNEQIDLKCSANNSGEASVAISKIDAEFSNTDITINGSTLKLDKTNGLKLLKDQSLELKVKKGVRLEATSFDQFFSLDPKNGNDELWVIKGTGKLTNPINLTAKSNGVAIKINVADDSIPVTVGLANVPSVATIAKGDRKLFEGIGGIIVFEPAAFAPTVGLSIPCNTANTHWECTDDNKIHGLISGRVDIPIKSEFGTFSQKSFVLAVVSGRYSLKITTPSGHEVFVDGGKLPLFAVVKDEDGLIISSPQIKWTIEDSNKQYISVPKSDTSIEVIGLKVPSDEKPIRITAQVVDHVEAIDEIPIFVRGKRSVVDFKPITVRIDMLDDRTARDLFGRVAAKEYHVAKIRIVNNLPASSGGGAASSVIFFSDALEVRVALEKKGKDAKNWTLINAENVYYINNWKNCDIRAIDMKESADTILGNHICETLAEEAFADCDIEYAGVAEPLKTNKIAKCKAGVELAKIECQQRVKIVAAEGSCRDDDIDCRNHLNFCKTNALSVSRNSGDPLRNAQWIPFRPFVYQVVANTHDRRDERSWRSRLFLGAHVLGGATSFVTSVAVPGSGSDLPLGLDKYQNLLLPTFEKLFPSMREVQRQNILSEVLPPLVELPFGQDVGKYVFFPKKKIEGILPGYDVRIASISSYNIQVQVGIVQKGTLTQVP